MTTTHSHITGPLKARNEALAELAAIDAKANRLSALAQGSSAAVPELNALVSDHQIALAKWADTGLGDAPVIDYERKAKLEAEVRAYEASRQSANAAVQALNATREKHLATANAANAAATFAAVVEIAESELPAICEAVKAAAARLDAEQSRFTALWDFIRSEGVRRNDFSLHAVCDRLIEKANEMTKQPAAIPDTSPLFARLNALTARTVEA